METQTSRNHPRSDGLVPGSANATAGPLLGVKQLVAAVDWRAPPRPRALCPSKKRDVMPTPNKKPGIPSTACAIGRSGECFPRQAPFDCSSNLPGINSKKVCRRARRPGELGAAALPSRSGNCAPSRHHIRDPVLTVAALANQIRRLLAAWSPLVRAVLCTQ